jgi:hypothetical protein
MRRPLLIQLIRHTADLLNTPCNTKPLIRLYRDPTVLSIQPEMRIILPLNEPVFALVAVAAPGLDGERLILVVFVPGLFVRVFEEGLDGVGGGEGPENESFEEDELQMERLSRTIGEDRRCLLTRSSGVMLVNVPPAWVGFFPFHAAGHCD